MNRRDAVISLFAIGTSPLTAFAQQASKVWRIGFISGRARSPTPSSPDTYLDAFVQKMQELGYVEGKNLKIEWRYATGGNYESFPAYAAELVRLNVDVIVTNSLPTTLAAQRATQTIPIVFQSMIDPVGAGVVKSLARPEGNVTGFSLMFIDAIPKQVELLSSIIPRLSRIALLINPLVPIHSTVLKTAQSAAQQIGARILAVEARNPEEIERGFLTMRGQSAEALMVTADAFFSGHRGRISQLALKNRLPTMFPFAADAEAGGLLAYGQDLVDMYRRAAGYVDKIFKGSKISDLPIEQPTIFRLIVNQKTARLLHLKIPETVLILADRVIE
jgi:putative ABC transport system substrate-binding protein